MTLHQTTLSNGFTIVSERMEGLKSAALGIWVKSGARHETHSQNGIAHFLEHLAFKGTHSRSALQIAEAIENVGGYINAYTSKEMTAYYTRVLREDVTLAFDVIADIILNSVFDEKDIEIERNVILQEIGQSHDTADDIIFDWLSETAFANQAIGRPILGTVESVKNFKRGDFVQFVSHRYCAQDMILSASGDIEHDALVKKAEDIFGHLPPHKTAKGEEAFFTPHGRREIKELEQAHLTLAFEAPSQKAAHLYSAQTLSLILGGGMSSRLFQEIREKRGLCYSIFASLSPFSDSGMMTFYAGTNGEDANAVALQIIDEFKRALEDISQEEVKRAKAQLKAGLLMGLESPSARVERNARMVSIWGAVPALDETIAKIDDISVKTVREAGCVMLENKKLATVFYGPIEKTDPHEKFMNALAS